MQDFDGKVVVVTGGASGIGFATAAALAGQGARIVIADVNEAHLADAVSHLRESGADAVGVHADVSDLEAVTRIAEIAWSTFGGVHVLFGNAGVALFGPTQAMTHADWDWCLKVNLWGAIHCVEAFVPRMIKQAQGGHIVLTASFAGLIGNKNLGPYSVSKAAVVSLAECLSKDLRAEGIGVSVLCPMRVVTRIDDSHLIRPEELGGATAGIEHIEKFTSDVHGRTLLPDAVADQVLNAIRRNDLFVLTHTESTAFLERRNEKLREASKWAL